MKISPFLLLCATGLFAIFSSTLSKSPVLPLFAVHLGANPAGVGVVAAISAFTGVIFSIPAGLLSDRIGKRRMLLASAAIFFSAPLLYLFITEIWQLMMIRFFHGFATAIFIPVSMALISELFQSEKGEKMGWFSASTLLGRFIAPIAGGSVIGMLAYDPNLSYKIVYLICGTAGLITLLLTLVIPKTKDAEHKTMKWADTTKTFRSVISDKNIVITCVVEAAILFAYGIFETFLPLYAISIGNSAYQIGIFLSAQIITLALTKPVMGRFSDRHGRRLQIFAGAVIGAICISAFGLFRGFLPLLGLSVIFGLCLSVVTSASTAYIADLSSRESRGSAMGLLGSIMDIGHTTGPLAAGIIATRFGFPISFTLAGFVLIIASCLFAVSMIKQR